MTAGVGDVAVGQRNDSRRIRLPELGTGAWLSGNGTVLAGGGLQRRGWGAQPLGNGPVLTGKSPFNHMADHYGGPFQVIQYLQTKVVSNHKGSIPPHNCRPAHRPVRLTDDQSSSAPRQS